MEFPRTNKIAQLIPDAITQNAQLLEDLYDSIKWGKLLNFYARFFGIFLISLFLLIAVVRVALLIP